MKSNDARKEKKKLPSMTAKEKKLAGAAKASFTKKCVSDAVRT